MEYVILAAGQGSRLVKEGETTPKPMLDILGRPMIERLIDVLMRSDAEKIHIVTNPAMASVNEHLAYLRDAKKYPIEFRPIVSDNSFYSLLQAAEGIKGRFIAMTVDAIFPTEEFQKYVQSVVATPADTIPMALTRFVDDESPLYAKISDDGLEVLTYRYGGEPFDGKPVVSAGIYGLTREAIDYVMSIRFPESLSDFQRILAEDSKFKLQPCYFSKAFDVDRGHDREVAEQFLMEVNGEVNHRASKSYRDEYRQSLKSSDTEEHIDLAFYRPIGFFWAILARKLRITPNMITIASIFIGVAAGLLMYPNKLWINVLGILCLILANSFDSADGQLARLTKQYSRLGRILDGMAGDIWFIAIYLCIVFRMLHTDVFFITHEWVIWTIAVAAGICHARQAALADRFRQFHLMFLKKEFPTELENSQSVLSQLKSKKSSFQKLILVFYYGYTKVQERSTPYTQKFLSLLLCRYPDGKVPEELAKKIRKATLPLCKWENFLTFNWRSITLTLSLLVGIPWLYFVAELSIFNVVYLYLKFRHESICKGFVAKLKLQNQ